MHGLERLDQIKYAVLERSGGITVVPDHVGWSTADGSAEEVRSALHRIEERLDRMESTTSGG